MRRRLAIPLILAAAAILWFWYKPPSPAANLPAKLVSSVTLDIAEDWFGGLSGIDVSDDGNRVHMVTDRGHIMRGRLDRDAGALVRLSVEDMLPLTDKNGVTRDFPHTDAEGIAVDEEGQIYVSFEHAHRVLLYPAWGAPARWPSYTRSWRALSRNGGLEALAIDKDGTLYTLPEKIADGASEALVYRRQPNQKWEQPFTIPVAQRFAPVGADFGPNGRFYLLERGVYPFGFFSRVRLMDITRDGVENISTLLETRLGQFGNLEGISVWRDANGYIRLTMVSDDNFIWLLRSQIVEYVLPPGVALPGQPD